MTTTANSAVGIPEGFTSCTGGDSAHAHGKAPECAATAWVGQHRVGYFSGTGLCTWAFFDGSTGKLRNEPASFLVGAQQILCLDGLLLHTVKALKPVWVCRRHGPSGPAIALDIASGLRHLHDGNVGPQSIALPIVNMVLQHLLGHRMCKVCQICCYMLWCALVFLLWQAILRDMNPTLTEDLKHARIAGFTMDLMGRRPPTRSSISVYPSHMPLPRVDWTAPEVRVRNLNVCKKVRAIPYQ